MVKSFDWFTTKTYVGSSSNQKLLSSTLHNLCKIQFLFLLKASFWLTVETWINKTNKLVFSDQLSLYQEKLIHLSNFIRPAVVLSRVFVPFEWFAQTRCLGMVILLITFLRQPVTILWKLVPNKMFSQTSCLNI